jgi:hypothetical protein
MTEKKYIGPFELLGYVIEFYSMQNKYLGSIPIDEPDREVFGYGGKQDLIAEEDIITNKNKRIKKGTQVTTELLPLCGRAKKHPLHFLRESNQNK